MPARTERAYAASKHAHAVAKSSAALALLPLESSSSTFWSRVPTGPVKVLVGMAAIILTEGTSGAPTSLGPTSRVIDPASCTVCLSTRCRWLPMRVVKSLDTGTSLRWWMYSRRPDSVDERSAPS
jgi:hypothetical protein